MSTPASPCLEDVPCWPHEQPDPPREGNQRSEQGKQYLQSSEQQQRPSASAVDVECVLANAADTEKLHETATYMEREALEAEQQFLAIAMAESLDEDNARKAAERPLEEWDDKCLLERFKASQILREYPDGAAALGESCRKDFINALEFERQAMKWYPVAGTGFFFAEAASKSSAKAAASAQHGKAQKERRGRRTGKPAGEQPGPGAQSKRLESFVLQLSSQIQDAKDVVYGMPDGDIPQIFRSAGDESQEDPEIEFLEESGPYKKKTKVVYNLC